MLFPPSSFGVSAPLFYAALLASVLGLGAVFDHMSAPVGARSVDAVELVLSALEEREHEWVASWSPRRPS